MASALTTAQLVHQISLLGTETEYEYVSGNNIARISEVTLPEGPISFYRRNRNGNMELASISTQQLATFARICSAKPNFPLHVDRLFSGGGNTRSAVETLLARTPNFYICHPERVDVYTGKIKTDLKHIMWCPEDYHTLGEVAEKDYKGIITEQETSINYGDIRIGASSLGSEFDSIEAKRVHTQMQVSLIAIGNALNLDTWIARNDHSISIGAKTLVDLPGVMRSLDAAEIFFKPDIKEAASLIDCIWFTRDGRAVPAIFEIEHSTGVTSGLTRMLKLRERFPGISEISLFTIVASDELRAKVISEISQPIFQSLKARYMPYTNVRELYGLIQRYSLVGVVDYRFVEAFMEQIV